MARYYRDMFCFATARCDELRTCVAMERRDMVTQQQSEVLLSYGMVLRYVD